VDAEGCLVTPGFVDIHTHYDGQVMWSDRPMPASGSRRTDRADGGRRGHSRGGHGRGAELVLA
jgi:cytosine/adenosine deaminase-related metal-dependent hydrolase